MKPSVCVMMSTYNGQRYLKEQIDSILAQEHTKISLYIRDDGSSDKTIPIIKEYMEKHDNIHLITGENLGYAKSFWTLIKEVPESFEYYALSDQDDVWEPKKLAAAIYRLYQCDDTYKLYASALKVADDNLKVQYTNDFPKLKITLGSALTRPRLSGCTFVFNSTLLGLLRKMDLCKTDITLSHDVAIYLATLACGGRVLYSKNSYILLRRHEGTVTVHGKSVLTHIRSVTDIMTKRKKEASKQAAFLFEQLSDEMTEDSKKLFADIFRYPNSIIRTLRMCFDKRIKCNLRSVDTVNILAILFHCY